MSVVPTGTVTTEVAVGPSWASTLDRLVWDRDEGRCAFVGITGRRCEERKFLEFHHVKPWAASGPPTVENLALRCRAHNRYEAERYFGPIRAARRSSQRMTPIGAASQRP